MKKIIPMITVLCDGNYIFHKTFGIFSGFGSKNPGDVLSSEAERNMFIRKVITDLCYSLNQIPEINRIIFCKDSRSWRKDYKITRSVYKESRVKSEGVDWGSFFKLMDEFGDFLEENGFIYSSYQGAEGDDLIWAWCDYLKDSDDCVIVISGDKDMHQLVDYTDKRWTGIWNTNSKNNKLVVHSDWVIGEKKEPTIFDVTPASGSNDSKIEKLVSSCIIEKIDIKEFVFKKILMGDKKDDVPGVFPYQTKNGKNANIAEGKSQKIWDLYTESPWAEYSLEEIWQNEDFLGWVAGLSLRLISQTDNKENREKFKKFYEENARLVWLNSESIPHNMVQGLRNHVIELDMKDKSPVLIDKKIMIEKSPWAKDSTPPRGFDPFDLFK
jgi:5'-3' exonuclease